MLLIQRFPFAQAAMAAVAEERGMRTDYTYQGSIWQVVSLARAATAGW